MREDVGRSDWRKVILECVKCMRPAAAVWRRVCECNQSVPVASGGYEWFELIWFLFFLYFPFFLFLFFPSFVSAFIPWIPFSIAWCLLRSSFAFFPPSYYISCYSFSTFLYLLIYFFLLFLTFPNFSSYLPPHLPAHFISFHCDFPSAFTDSSLVSFSFCFPTAFKPYPSSLFFSFFPLFVLLFLPFLLFPFYFPLSQMIIHPSLCSFLSLFPLPPFCFALP